VSDLETATFIMVREDLGNIPQYPPPDGYQMRRFRPGDRETWGWVWRSELGGGAEQTFDRVFGHDTDALARRCLFLVSPEGDEVGTITAWYERYRGRRWGRLHWVGIVPAYRGRGLCKCMVTAALNRLREFRHRRCMLGTEPFRIPAIRTYLRFGFVPDPRDQAASRVRDLLRARIGQPGL
jgi:RimJ/RimL family protein N-acetyltransferase